MKIMKFGGTSVGSASRIQAVARLVTEAGRNLVVLSAMSGTTNTLEEIVAYLYNRNADGAKDTISRLEAKYQKTLQELYATEEAREQCGAHIRSVFDGLWPSPGSSSARCRRRWYWRRENCCPPK